MRAEAVVQHDALQGTPLLAAIVASSEDAIVGKTLDGSITAWNAGAERLYGYSPREAIGQPITLIVPPDRVDELADIMRRIRAGQGTERLNTERVRNDGRRVCVNVTVSPIRERSGEVVGAVSVARDTTLERRAGENQRMLADASASLSASLDYAATLQTVARLVVPAVADYCVVDLFEAEDRLQRVAVAHRDAGAESLLREAATYPPDPRGDSPLAMAMRTREPTIVDNPDESWLSAVATSPRHKEVIRLLAARSIMLVPLIARDRTLGLLTLAATESSGRIYDHGDLLFADELARRCAMAVDNARLYQQAQEAIRLRDEVLATVSHDLKAPLTTIKGQAGLLQRRAARSGALDLEHVRKGLELIDTAATNMATWIDELLDTARLQVGRPLELRYESTDLVELAWRAAALQQQTTERHRIRVETSEHGLVGLWDPARLNRVLTNLLGNAVKYSPTGGDVVLSIEREVKQQRKMAVVRVADHGLGIPAADLPHVFEQFHRGSNVTGRVAGTGLGLAAARQIVEQHGGSLEVASQEHQGSTFTMRLPLVPDRLLT